MRQPSLSPLKRIFTESFKMILKNIPLLTKVAKKNPSDLRQIGSRLAYSSEATFEVKACKLHRLDSGPATQVTLNKDDALKMYRQMALVRRMETAAGNLYKARAVRGFCHLYSGQEAVAGGMVAAMKPQDTVITSYRCHGWTYLMGSSVFQVLAELLGKKGGVSRGKGGSMHMYCKNFYGGNGIVGGQVPLGAGLAFAHKYKGDGGINLCLFGDGAANQGQNFEAYNMAKIMSLPVIFICENNGYGMGTSAERSSASVDYYSRGDYVPGIQVDGMDVLAVREATRWAREILISGNGPLMMEVVTYRYAGHSMSDPGTSYRSRDEVQKMRSTRDPIGMIKDRIISANLASPEDLKAIDVDIKKEVDKAVADAKADVEIAVEERSADIYSLNLETHIKDLLSGETLTHQNIGKALNK